MYNTAWPILQSRDRILQLTEPRRQGVNKASNSFLKKSLLLYLFIRLLKNQLKKRGFAHLVVTNRDLN